MKSVNISKKKLMDVIDIYVIGNLIVLAKLSLFQSKIPHHVLFTISHKINHFDPIFPLRYNQHIFLEFMQYKSLPNSN